MLIRKTLLTCFNAAIALLAMKFTAYVMPIKLEMMNMYFFIVLAGTLNAMKGIHRARKGKPPVFPWWAETFGLGLGLGIYAFLDVPNANAYHILILTLLSLVTTIVAYDLLNRLSRKR